MIQPEQELSVNWTITTFGFTKEPTILWMLFKTPISEAYGTITLITFIPELPSTAFLVMFMLLAFLAVVLVRKFKSDKESVS